LNPEVLTAFGAFLSGVGAVAGAFFTIGRVRKQMKQECNERLAEVMAAYEKGATVEHLHEVERLKGPQ